MVRKRGAPRREGYAELLALHSSETTSRHAAQLRWRWNGISKSEAKDIAKTTASGTAMAKMQERRRHPGAHVETTHSMIDHHDDRRVGQVQAVRAGAETLERTGLQHADEGPWSSDGDRREQQRRAQARARDRPRRSCRRSIPIRASPRSARQARLPRAPASAAEARVRSDATRMPAATMPAVNSAANCGLSLISMSTCDSCGAVAAVATTIAVIDVKEENHAPLSPDEEEEREQKVELGLDRDRPERAVRDWASRRRPGPGSRGRPRTSQSARACPAARLPTRRPAG